MGYSPWGHKELDTTQLSLVLPASYLRPPRSGGGWQRKLLSQRGGLRVLVLSPQIRIGLVAEKGEKGG